MDNGAKPTPPVTTTGQSAGVPRPIPVLNRYLVDGLDGWQAADGEGTTVLTAGGEKITLLLGTAMCGIPSEKTQYGVDIAWCSATETDLQLAGAVIRAEHSSRDDAITRILRSFRQQTGG